MNANPPVGKIYSLDIYHDLHAVADLIELAFADQMDPDGRDYVHYLRRLGDQTSRLYWGMGSFQNPRSPLQGFVWKDDDKVVGNLSLIPFNKGGKFIYLIANVAVHPDYRRLGIARKLTQQALEYARQKSAVSAWLQVRDDNPAAYHLYQTSGFIERKRRTTWLLDPKQPVPIVPPVDAEIGRRKNSEWIIQKQWLDELYPPDVTWNLPYRKERFKPGLLAMIRQLYNGLWVRNWTAKRENEILGVLTWESTNLFADSLWLASCETWESEAIRSLIPGVRRNFSGRKPVMLNYPAGRGSGAFQQVGFTHHNTLIWMECRLKFYD